MTPWILRASCLGVVLVPLNLGVGAEGSASLEQMSQELQQLRAEVRQLRAERSDTWLNQRRVEEVKALVREVLADADTRASLAATGMTAGWDKHFFLASEDGSFLLALGGRIQLRYVYNNRDIDGDHSNPSYDNEDENEFGFQVRRYKLNLRGHVADPRVQYNVVLSGDRVRASVGLEEATMSARLTDDGLTLYGGRTKAPFAHEELISSGSQLAVDRSVVNETFTVGFVEGVGLRSQGEALRWTIMIHDGQYSGEVPTLPPPYFPPSVPGAESRDFNGDQSDWAVSGRMDLKLAGQWQQWDDFSAWSGEPLGLFLGLAGHYEASETGNVETSPTPVVGDNDHFFVWTLDAGLEVAGWSFFGSIVGRHDDDEDGIPSENNRDAYGVVAQMGYMLIPDVLEPFIRYEWLTLDKINDPSNPADENQIITVGVNYYLKRHDAKFSFDCVVVAQDALFNTFTGLGLLADDIASSGSVNNHQVALRAQFQLQY